MNFRRPLRPSALRRSLLGATLLAPSLSAVPTAWAAARPAPATGYLAQLAEHLELPVTPQVQRKLAAAVPVRDRRAISIAVEHRLQKVVGAALSTASETIAACIEDDLSARRTQRIGGLSFSHTELALLLAASSAA
jgi:hypothetical protein